MRCLVDNLINYHRASTLDELGTLDGTYKESRGRCVRCGKADMHRIGLSWKMRTVQIN